MPEGAERPSASLTSLSLHDAAWVLSKSGSGIVTVDMLRQDLQAGAPFNPDGTLNLIHYAAWLVKVLADGD